MPSNPTTTRLHALSNLLPFSGTDVRLRELAEDDAARMALGAADPSTQRWAYTREDDLSVAAVVDRIRGQYRDEADRGDVLRLAVADPETDRYLGLLALFADRGSSVEVGFVIVPDSRGSGVAQRTLLASAELARLAGYTELRARTDVENHAAQRTLERAGFQAVGAPKPPISEQLQHVRLQPYRLDLAGGPADLQRLLEQLVRDTGITGAQVAISHRGEIQRAAAGVLSVRTGLGVTHESIFQIGSITKLFTTVLVLQLVDDGLVRLTDPIVDHVPSFRLADAEFARSVRIIDLLQHRGGFDGDVFTDGGRGADAPQAIIAELARVELFSPPGEHFAYSNAGMVVLGRLVELKRDTDYLRAVRERIYAPLGLEHAVTLPEEAILFGVSVGHTRDAEGDPVVMPTWQLPMSAAATGAVLTMSAESLARFGEMLLNGGVSRGGERVLSEEMALLMGKRSFALPVATPVGEGFATGSFTYRYDGATAYGHDGQTIGQVAGLRIVPERDLVIAITTNRENAAELTESVIDFALRQYGDARVPQVEDLPSPALEPEVEFIAGDYSNHTMTAAVTVDDGVARLRLGARTIEMGNQPAMRLHRIGDGTYRVLAAEHGIDLTFVFMDSDGDGVADFLWFNRMLRRDPASP